MRWLPKCLKRLLSVLIVVLPYACVQLPQDSQLPPYITVVGEVADYSSVVLSASFDHVANLKSAGFLFWQGSGEKRRQQAPISEQKTISVEFSGLEPETEYQYAVYYSNGREERISDSQHFMTKKLPMPELAAVSVESGILDATIHLEFNSASFLESCTLTFWPAGSDFRKQISFEPGASLVYELSGLEADMEYQYSIIYSNGRQMAETAPASFHTQPAPQPPPQPEPSLIPRTEFDPVLWQYLVKNYDTDGDGEMSDVELSEIREVVLAGLPLNSLDGLEKLENLERLAMGDNTLTRIDVSANKKLQFLSAGADRYLEEIVLDNPELFQTYFWGLANLKFLDVSHCPELYICEWWDVPLERVDFSTNWNLFALRFGGTKLKELDLSANRKLVHLNSVNNPALKTIFLWSGIKLESLEADLHTEIVYK